MTLAALRSQARRYARIDTTAADDDQLNLLIQDAVDKFARDVGGFPMDVNLVVAAAFDTETNFAFNVKIVENGSTTVDTDVEITATAREDATGTTVASDLQTAIRAMTGAVGTETVVWADFYFTIDWKQGNTATGDSITIAAPEGDTYVDATEILGIATGVTTGATSITGGFPQDCTQYVSLPSDAIHVARVEWDYHELPQVGHEFIQSPEAQGDPSVYAVRGRRIYFSPSPDHQERLEAWYKGVPAAIDFASDTDVPTEIPEMYQEALSFLVAYYLLVEAFDDERSRMRYAQYSEIMRRYRVDYANNNTVIEENMFRSFPRSPSIDMGSRTI